MTTAEFVTANGITATVKTATRNPHMEPDKYMTRHFRITLAYGEKGVNYAEMRSIPFSQGSAHTENPTAADLLSCMANDAAGVANASNFEDWCAEYGYDTDSRRALKTYETVKTQAAALREFLGEDRYETLLWHTEPD